MQEDEEDGEIDALMVQDT